MEFSNAKPLPASRGNYTSQIG